MPQQISLAKNQSNVRKLLLPNKVKKAWGEILGLSSGSLVGGGLWGGDAFCVLNGRPDDFYASNIELFPRR